MKTRRIVLCLAFIVTAALWCDAPLRAADGPYRLLTEIKVGSDGGWDYLAVDSAARRLYVSHATKAVVIDLDKNVVVGEITPANGIHGIAIAADLGKLFVSNGRDNSASIVDAKTLQITATVKTGENPDCILYEPGHKEVYTFNGRGKNATVFDAATGEVKATIPLPGKPEFAVVDVKAGRIYNNIEDTSEIVVIDTTTHAVVAKWPIAPGEGASGLSIDLVNHRLFAVAGNKLLVAVDSVTGKVLSTLPIGEGVDATSFDPATGYVFASNSDNTVTVATCDKAGKLSLVQALATPARSRTMTLDPKTHRIYISAAEFTAPAPAAAGAPPQRPQMVPGSFKVVVYEMAAAPAPAQTTAAKPSTDWQQTFAAAPADLMSVGENPYFILKPGYQLTLEGKDGAKTVRLVISVLDETKTVGGIEARVVEERETENGVIVEVSRNYFAIHKTTKDVYYLGEDVDIYKNGKVVDHEGAWLHGVNGARFGLLMPAAPVVGQRYYQEVAPKVAMDRAEVVSLSARLVTPAGTFERCLETEESTPLEGGKERKLYAPGVGLIKDGALHLVSVTKR